MREFDDNLARFRYHTGATLRRLAPDELCPRLYRDIGPEAMARFLDGRLTRLAGPLAPILYARTAEFGEPYQDYEPVGRLVFLNPRELRPWFSGIAHVYVASVHFDPGEVTVGFLPAHIDTNRAEALLEGVSTLADLRDALGGRDHHGAILETRASLERLNAELAETEVRAEPIRRRLQSRDRAEVEAARDWIARHGLTETDLCSSWHHLPRERRAVMRDALELPASAK
jgi:hypothetical protein